MKREYDPEEVSAGESAAGDDELLAALGYKVRSSEMAEVALKLDQLDKALAAGADDGASFLASDTVHYNPSDLSSWLENMLSELNPPTPPPPPSALPRLRDSDLSAIPGGAAFPLDASEPKRQKRSGGSAAESTRPVVLVDSQEAGIRLVHALMASAEAVQEGNTRAAEALIKQIGVLAALLGGVMRKVATYFGQALARRIYRIGPVASAVQPPPSSSLSDTLQMHFYESCPYLKFAHFTANQAILEAFAGKRRVHVIDLGMKHGMQWPALMQALARCPDGPPLFRLTAVAPPSSADSLREVGWKLLQFADTIQVNFEFRSLTAESVADLEAELLDIRRSNADAVAVNSVFELHRYLARPGAVEKALAAVKAGRPSIVTVVEQEAEHNAGGFVERFTEALHYYSTMFDSLEGTEGCRDQNQVMSEMYLGLEICNVVGCEGEERVERHEPMARWRARMGSAGFGPVHLGSNAFKQASMLLALFGCGEGYRVEEREGCLTLGWYTRPLIATSAWRIRQDNGAGRGR